MATAVCDALWGSIPIITFMTTSLVVVGHHGGTPAYRLFVLDPLLSHSVGEARAGGSSIESQPVHTGGRHFMSYPARTSERYGLTTTSAYILKQALRRQSAEACVWKDIRQITDVLLADPSE